MSYSTKDLNNMCDQIGEVENLMMELENNKNKLAAIKDSKPVVFNNLTCHGLSIATPYFCPICFPLSATCNPEYHDGEMKFNNFCDTRGKINKVSNKCCCLIGFMIDLNSGCICCNGNHCMTSCSQDTKIRLDKIYDETQQIKNLNDRNKEIQSIVKNFRYEEMMMHKDKFKAAVDEYNEIKLECLTRHDDKSNNKLKRLENLILMLLSEMNITTCDNNESSSHKNEHIVLKGGSTNNAKIAAVVGVNILKMVI